MTARPLPPGLRLLPALLALLLLAGCRVDVSVEVEADIAGRGVVRATVRLDREAVEQVPDLAGQLRTDDLAAAGWAVDGPAPAAGGAMVVRLSKPFDSAAEATRTLGELGPPFRSLRLTAGPGLWRTRTRLRGAIDLSGGLGVFGDEVLEQRLGGAGLGLDPAAVERDLGRPPAEVFAFEVVGDLPGRVEANTPARRSGDVVWPAVLGSIVVVEATSHAWNVPRLALSGVALLSGAALVVVLVRRSRAVSWT